MARPKVDRVARSVRLPRAVDDQLTALAAARGESVNVTIAALVANAAARADDLASPSHMTATAVSPMFRRQPGTVPKCLHPTGRRIGKQCAECGETIR